MRLKMNLSKTLTAYKNYSLQPLHILLAGIVVSSVLVVIFQSILPLAIIPLILLVFAAVIEVKWIYYLMFLLIPLSTEMDLPGGISIDFPDELFMLALMFIFIFWAAQRFFQWDIKPLLHPISLLLLAHYCWTFVAAIQAEDTIISIKFFLSKTWFIIVFYLMAFYLLTTNKNYKVIFTLFFWALLFTVLVITYRHWVEQDFSFSGVNFVVGPFYRNHVTYGAIGAVFLPFLFWLIKIRKHKDALYYTYIAGFIIIFIGMNLSYTRAAIGAAILAVGFGFIIHYKLTKPVLLTGMIISTLFVANLLRNDNYLNLAPQYEKTITHETFNNLLDATYKLEDISTMERVYRWVAGFHMVQQKPFLGYGPGNFHNEYKSHTINKFRTFVSDNKDQSGVHNYFLMLAVEQGIPGMIIFLVLVLAIFIYAEKIYHLCTDAEDRWLTLAAILSFFIIIVMQLMNDLIETDKIGSIFFICIAIIVRTHQKYLPVKIKPVNKAA